MRLSRISIGWLMIGIAMIGVPLALMQNFLSGRSITQKTPAAELGLWPTLIAFGFASITMAKRRSHGSPFLWGFTGAGWASVLLYLAACFWLPRIVERPITFYNNEIDYWWIVWLIDADRYELYLLNRLFLGLLLAIPQLMMATLGGLITRWIWGNRWNST